MSWWVPVAILVCSAVGGAFGVWWQARPRRREQPFMREMERAYLQSRRAGGYPSAPRPVSSLPKVAPGPAPGARGHVTIEQPTSPSERRVPPPPTFEDRLGLRWSPDQSALQPRRNPHA